MYRLCLLLALAIALPLFGEERTFSITTDGKPAGAIVFEFQKRDEGVTTVSMRAEYHKFDYHGTETWKDGRLVRLKGFGVENGHKGGITLVAGKDAYALKAGVKDVSIRGEVWPTTATMPPDPDRKPLVVDAITGDVLHAKVEKVGADRIEVAGRAIAATRYRITAGASHWDVWFDDSNRLVKRVWKRDGKVVAAELTRINPD